MGARPRSSLHYLHAVIAGYQRWIETVSRVRTVAKSSPTSIPTSSEPAEGSLRPKADDSALTMALGQRSRRRGRDGKKGQIASSDTRAQPDFGAIVVCVDFERARSYEALGERNESRMQEVEIQGESYSLIGLEIPRRQAICRGRDAGLAAGRQARRVGRSSGIKCTW